MKKKTFNITLGAPYNQKKLAKTLIGSSKLVITLITYYGLYLEFRVNNIEYLLSGLGAKTKLKRLSCQRSSNSSRITIVSVNAFTELVTLIKAALVIIIEPQENTAIRDQILMRVFRIRS